jgi:HAMP domain-containing protein
MHEIWGMAALWIVLALIATLLSIWFRIAAALSEIVAGTVAQLSGMTTNTLSIWQTIQGIHQC